MNKKVFGYALLPALVLTLVGAGTASAHGMFGGGMSNATPEEIASRQQEMFTHQSTLLGISVDEIKNAWAKGQTLQELAKEKGISEEQLKQKMMDERKQKMQEHLQTLVDKGVITKAQADERAAFMEKHAQSGGPGKKGGPGFGGGFGHGPRLQISR